MHSPSGVVMIDSLLEMVVPIVVLDCERDTLAKGEGGLDQDIHPWLHVEVAQGKHDNGYRESGDDGKAETRVLERQYLFGQKPAEAFVVHLQQALAEVDAAECEAEEEARLLKLSVCEALGVRLIQHDLDTDADGHQEHRLKEQQHEVGHHRDDALADPVALGRLGEGHHVRVQHHQHDDEARCIRHDVVPLTIGHLGELREGSRLRRGALRPRRNHELKHSLAEHEHGELVDAVDHERHIKRRCHLLVPCFERGWGQQRVVEHAKRPEESREDEEEERWVVVAVIVG
mmetsp:Transcript_27770/g.70841  ORF Transcript_27770/g.70841 Transcript_27770/m.70841 type:complete len:288 (-) Transcript_27770:524-1387(-)